MHYWQNDIGLIEGLERGKENPLEIHDVDRMLRGLKGWIEGDERLELIKASLPTGRVGDAAVRIDDLMSPHFAKDQELLATAVRAINLDDPSLHYEAWITLLRAICAACAHNHEFFTDVVWPWICTQTVTHGEGPRTEDRGIEWLEAKWDSFHDSELGAEHIQPL